MAACVCPALSAAREELQAEVSRHDAVLRDLDFEGVDDADDAEFERTLMQLTRDDSHQHHHRSSISEEDTIFPSAALQLVEEKIEERSRLKTGYLRKASKHGKRRSWRFHRVELRREVDAFWLNYVPADAKRLSDKTHDLTMLKERHVRLLPNGNTACDKPVARAGESSSAGVSGAAACDSPPPPPRNSEAADSGTADSTTTRRSSLLWTKKVSMRRTTEKQDSCLFSLNVSDEHSSVWMASSPQERDEWIRAISDASELSSQPDDASNLASPSRDGEDEASNKHITEFLAAIDRVSKISCRNEFVKALIPIGKIYIAGEAYPSSSSRFSVPVRWVRRNFDGHYPIVTTPYTPRPTSSLQHKWRNLLSSPSSNTKKQPNGEAPCPSPDLRAPTVGSSSQLFSQMRKDMRRDRVSIDGEIIRSEDDEHREEKVARVLASHMFSSAQRRGSLSSLTQAGALEHACAILVASTRTSSGGDAYACVQALCHPIADQIVVCPLSTRASPLEFTVLRATPSPDSPASHRSSSSCTSLVDAEGKNRQSKSEPTTPTSFAGRLFATLVPNAHSTGEKLASSCTSSTDTTRSRLEWNDDDGNNFQQRHSRPHVNIRVKATSVYRICTSNPQDLPTDTWGVVRAEWTQEFFVFGDPGSNSNFRASDANVELTVSDFAPWETSDFDLDGSC